MISINRLSISFSGNPLFDDLSFIIKDKDRIGLTGKNGAGKSTLLKILSKQQESDNGHIVLTAGHEIGYLPQEMIPDSTKSVMDEALTAFDKIKALELEMEHLTFSLSDRTDYESEAYHKIIDRLSETSERFHLLDGGNREAQAEKILLGLGFKHTDFVRSITEFSSGWQMRVELAKILLKRPEVMLLDEPTNHLDIESIEWLEGFLQNYAGAVVVVSHDRKFLDHVTQRTIEIVLGHIEDYAVPYSQYIIQREERRAIQQNAYANQQREIESMERFVERFRYKASKARQAQSRLKVLNKMERIEVDELDQTSITFRFAPAPHSGRVLIRTEDLGKAYDGKEVFNHADLSIERGEKVALVGRNGEGKSTFSKIVVGDINDHSGVLELGHAVKIGYFAQNQAALLDGEQTVFETIDRIAVGDIRSRIRNILGCFLFSGEDIDKKVKVLSGGEKTRLAIAKLLLEPVNLLILDEPTNHLDMRSKDILKNALLQYDGALIIVSHDRDFLEGLTQKVYEFRDGKVRLHIGDVNDFLQDRKLEQLGDLNQKASTSKVLVKAAAVTGKTPLKPPQNNASAQAQRDEKKKLEKEDRKRKGSLEKLENEITTLEQKLAEMDQVFISEPAQCTPESCRHYEDLQRQLDLKMKEWERLA